MASKSIGAIERRSRTSIDLPSSCAAAAASRQTLTIGPYATSVRSLPSRAVTALCSGPGMDSVSTSPLSQ
ncbi:hypothetical protein SBADM41S_10768 [Streptomyces badius]